MLEIREDGNFGKGFFWFMMGMFTMATAFGLIAAS